MRPLDCGSKHAAEDGRTIFCMLIHVTEPRRHRGWLTDGLGNPIKLIYWS